MVRVETSAGRTAIFGEVLFDRFEDGSEVLGGAPFNVAWNLKGLGGDPLLLSRVGDDRLGQRVRAAMEEWGLDTTGLQTDPELPTGTVEVVLNDGEPSFEILADRAYDRIAWEALPARLDLDVLYLGSLALRHPAARTTAERLIRHHRPWCFVDVNLRPPWWDRDGVGRLLAAADVIKLNHDELAELAPGDGDASRAGHLLTHSATDRIWVTRGARGAATFASDGTVSESGPVGDVEVVDTVGAGDAFSAVVLLGRLQGWNAAESLARAQQLASAVVGIRGATTRDRELYDRFRQAWRCA